MGMFDYIEDYDVPCPRCGSKQFIRIQTKNIDPHFGGTMEKYYPHYPPSAGKRCWICKPFIRIGEPRTHRLPEDHSAVIRGSASCNNHTCLARERAIQFLESGHVSGWGFDFALEYRTRNKWMIGPPKVSLPPPREESKYSRIPMVRLGKLLAERAGSDKRNRSEWKRAMLLAGENPLLAVLEFNPAFPKPRAQKRGRAKVSGVSSSRSTRTRGTRTGSS